MSVRFIKWARPITAALCDQIAFSGTGFLLNVLLARWLAPESYGAFAVGSAGLLILAGVHASLVTEPMNVVGPRQAATQLQGYVRILLVGHALVTVPIAAIGIVVGLILSTGNLMLGMAIVSMAVALPLVLLFWLLRGVCYLRTRPGVALEASLLYFVGILAVLFSARARGQLGALTGFVAMALASVLASIWLIFRLGVTKSDEKKISARLVAGEHWAYGRWILGASFAHNVAQGAYVPLVAGFVGLAGTGVFRAVQNLFLPLQQVVISLTQLVFPVLSSRAVDRERGHAERRGLEFLGGITALALLYGIGGAVLGPRVFAILYGKNAHAIPAHLITVSGLAVIPAAIAACLGILVRVFGRTSSIFWSKVAPAIWLVTGGILIVKKFGTVGAAGSFAVGSCAEAALLGWSLGRVVGKKR